MSPFSPEETKAQKSEITSRPTRLQLADPESRFLQMPERLII